MVQHEAAILAQELRARGRDSRRANSKKPAMKVARNPSTFASTSEPLSSKTLPALGMTSRPSQYGRVSRVRSTDSHAFCESAVPNREGDVPMTATGRPLNTRSASSAGRESQSTTFFATPGIELLYSGVEISRPSAAAMRSFNSATAGGNAELSTSKL